MDQELLGPPNHSTPSGLTVNHSQAHLMSSFQGNQACNNNNNQDSISMRSRITNSHHNSASLRQESSLDPSDDQEEESKLSNISNSDQRATNDSCNNNNNKVNSNNNSKFKSKAAAKQQQHSSSNNDDNNSSDSSFAEEHSISPPKEGRNGGLGGLGGVGSPKALNNQDEFHIPPPEELIAKTHFTQEPIKTGAPINLLKIDILRGEENNCELMGQVNGNGNNGGSKPGDTELAAVLGGRSKLLAEEIVKSYNDGKIVYSRFGKQYIVNLEKQINAIATVNQTTVSTSLKSASFLINIKKLIKDHNIESEQFAKLKTKTSVSKNSEVALPYYYPDGPTDKTLVFESRFESGNLLTSTKVSDNEYDLVLQNDINTNGHTQWYFFRVANTRKNLKVKFNVLNLAKPDSLYNQGMKILAFSQNAKRDQGRGWHRVGTDILYSQNNFKRENTRFTRYYYTFTFTYEFECNEDQVYFAHCFPYTYSDLADDLGRIEKDPATTSFFHRNTLTRTLAGNKCDYLTITSKDNPKQPRVHEKKGVFISARVHPGESNASWMMKGLIDFLVSNAPEARVLRDRFIFKIIPMINPDGVINGNYRCSLVGQDLNRRYKAPSKVLHPVIFSIKRLVKSFSKEREMALYCDLHGHSRRKNIFMYGNNYSDKPDVTRVFPYILSKLCDYFSFEQSRFSMHKSKEATARMAMWKEIKIPSIYTLEASFSGADMGSLKDQHFTTDHLMNTGRKLLEALLVYCKIDVTQSLLEIRTKGSSKSKTDPLEDKTSESITPSQNLAYKALDMDNLAKELRENKELIKMTEGREDGDGDDTSGSDSDPSEDNLEEEEMAKIVPIKLTKKKKGGVQDKKKGLTEQKTLGKKRIDELQAQLNAKKDAKNANISKTVVKSPPIKRIFNYSNPLYDRLKLRQLKKIEMVDAWTQTSDRGSDNEDATKQQAKGLSVTTRADKQHLRQENHYLTQPPDLTDTNGGSGSSGLRGQESPQKLVMMQDSASSPQPQIRVRKEPFKPNLMPTGLARFEEKLLSQQDDQQSQSKLRMDIDFGTPMQKNKSLKDHIQLSAHQALRHNKLGDGDLNYNNTNQVENPNQPSDHIITNSNSNVAPLKQLTSNSIYHQRHLSIEYGLPQSNTSMPSYQQNSSNPVTFRGRGPSNQNNEQQEIRQHASGQLNIMSPKTELMKASTNNNILGQKASDQQYQQRELQIQQQQYLLQQQNSFNAKRNHSQKLSSPLVNSNNLNGAAIEGGSQHHNRFKPSLMSKQEFNAKQVIPTSNHQRQPIYSSLDKSQVQIGASGLTYHQNSQQQQQQMLPELGAAYKQPNATKQLYFQEGTPQQQQASHQLSSNLIKGGGQASKYQLNSSAQNLAKTQNLFQLQQQQQYMKTQNGVNGFQDGAKNMDRIMYHQMQNQISKNNINNLLQNSTNINNLSSDFNQQNKGHSQHQIQLQNVKMRHILDKEGSNNNGTTNNSSSGNSNSSQFQKLTSKNTDKYML